MSLKKCRESAIKKDNKKKATPDDKLIRVTRASMPERQEYIDEISDLWQTHWLTNMGIKHKQLEAALLKYLNIPHIALFANGHLALEGIIETFHLTGEVITTPFTFASTTHALVRKGLTPVFCDIHSEHFTMDTEKIEALITPKTSAIVPVHVYGNICDVAAIQKIAQKYHLKVIYDAAHAFGVQHKGVPIGNFGDAVMFSFHATKIFHTIEGGAIAFRDPHLQRVLNNIKNFGIRGPESVEYVGGNAKMNEFQAAMGLCNLRHIEREMEKRKIVVARYRHHLANHKGINLVTPQENTKSNYAYFPVIFDGYKKTRDDVYHQLKKHNIFARKYFYPLTRHFECYHNRFDYPKTPVAEYIAERILTLPLYGDLNLNEVDRICRIILK